MVERQRVFFVGPERDGVQVTRLHPRFDEVEVVESWSGVLNGKEPGLFEVENSKP